MRPLRLVVLPLVSALLAVPLPGAAAAQGSVDFVVTAISPFVGANRQLELEVVVRNLGQTPVENAAVRLTFHDRTRTRSELRQALDGEPRSDVLAVTTEQLPDALAPAERRVVKINRDLATLASPFRSPTDGVYPLRIQLRVSGDTIHDAATAVPFFFDQPRSRLNVAFVLPIHAPASFDAGGAYEIGGLERSVQQGGRLDALLGALTDHSALAVTLAPTALTLDQLDDLGTGFFMKISGGRRAVHADDPVAGAARSALDRLRNIVTSPTVQTASSTYSRSDVVGLAHNGMASEIRTQIALERERDALLLGKEPASEVLVPAGFTLDSRSAAEIAAHGVRTIVVSPESLPGRNTRFGYDRPETVTGGAGVRFAALVVDPAIRDRLALPGGPVLRAQGVLAETAASYFEIPALAGERLIVIGAPPELDAAVARPLLDGLGGAPWVQLRTASDAAAALPSTEEPLAMPLQRVPDRPPLAAARAARRVVETLGSVLEEERPVELLQRLILAAESADWLEDPSRGSILARAARGSAERNLALIMVAPRHVTLTSRIAQIPVTILNETAQKIRVRIQLDSTKITFPDGAARTLEVPQRVLTVTFRAETRVTGAFPVTVRIQTPDGRAAVGEGQLVVRSTAVSAVTLVAMGGGALVLVAGWGRRFLRKRKREAPA